MLEQLTVKQLNLVPHFESCKTKDFEYINHHSISWIYIAFGFDSEGLEFDYRSYHTNTAKIG